MKNHIAKLILIFVVTVGAVIFGLNYLFMGSSPKSRAADETKIGLSFDPGSSAVTAGQSYAPSIKIKSNLTTDVILRGYDMKVTFDRSKLQLTKIEYKVGQPVADLGHTDENLGAINQSGVLRLAGEVTTSTGRSIPVAGIEMAKLTFTVTQATGTTIQLATNFYTVNGDMTITEGTITSPTTIDINGGGAIITSGATPTGGPTGNNVLNLKMKFQGITSKPGDPRNTMDVKVRLTGCGLSAAQEAVLKVTANDTGIWSGSVGFNLPACTTGTGYTVFLKGPRHIQRKICDATPTETSGGTYRCSDGKISIIAGQNNFDFSGILLLAGDVDQNGTVDSADISFVRNNLGKTDAAVLSKCDINLDGKCDTQDYSLVISALSVKVDEI